MGRTVIRLPRIPSPAPRPDMRGQDSHPPPQNTIPSPTAGHAWAGQSSASPEYHPQPHGRTCVGRTVIRLPRIPSPAPRPDMRGQDSHPPPQNTIPSPTAGHAWAGQSSASPEYHPQPHGRTCVGRTVIRLPRIPSPAPRPDMRGQDSHPPPQNTIPSPTAGHAWAGQSSASPEYHPQPHGRTCVGRTVIRLPRIPSPAPRPDMRGQDSHPPPQNTIPSPTAGHAWAGQSSASPEYHPQPHGRTCVGRTVIRLPRIPSPAPRPDMRGQDSHPPPQNTIPSPTAGHAWAGQSSASPEYRPQPHGRTCVGRTVIRLPRIPSPAPRPDMRGQDSHPPPQNTVPSPTAGHAWAGQSSASPEYRSQPLFTGKNLTFEQKTEPPNATGPRDVPKDTCGCSAEGVALAKGAMKRWILGFRAPPGPRYTTIAL